MQEHFANIIEACGEDLNREGLRKTPARAAKAFEFLTSGYQMDPKTVVNDALFKTNMSEMIIVKDIELYSLCEHHLLPFIGKCHVAYIPNGKVIGLSKIPRLVDIFARRLQIQEGLSGDIADCIMDVTGAEGVGVVIESRHLCMMMRGVEKQNASMTTSVMRGCFLDNPATRHEFLSQIR